jgi:drug/metabolite transporter (DMT)-like permease
MHWTRIVGIALVVVGVVLLLMGWNAADSLAEDIHEGVTGRFTDTTTL